MNKAIQLPPK